MKTQNRKKSIAKKLKTNEDVQKQKETPSPLKETTTESTPTRRTKANAARGLHLQNTPPSENPPTTPQTETMNVQNTRILSPVIQNDSTKTPEAKAVKIKDKIGKNSETKVARVQKKEKEQVNKRKRDEKAKKEEQVKKKMVKLKGKKVEDDDEDFVVEEQHDEEDDNKNFELKFKSLRARTTVLPLYDATEYLSPERKSKIREMGFASMLDFPFQKIPGKLPYFCWVSQWGKKLESDSPRDFNDEFLTAFKKQFEGKKYPTTTDLSKLIQRTTNIDFMFQINYLMLFANCMINCDNTSRLKYYVIKNIKSSDIISDFDWCSFIWDHIKTSKIGWDDRTLQNWYYGPNTVLMLIYLHYTKCDGMVTITRKWPAIRNWTSKDANDREIIEMSQGKFGLVDVIEEIEETENESEVEKRKLKEAAEKEKKEKAEKEAAENKKAEMRKAAAEKKEQAEIQAAAEAKLKYKMQKDAEEKKQSPSKKKKNNKSEPTAEKGDISEVVFDDGKGTIAHRKEMQSLAPGTETEKQIIDTLVTVLNYEERIRTVGKDLRRRYFPTDAVNQAKKYESFENVIKNQMNASESKKKMKDVELAFFPTVVAAGQYYVIVFNLLKANAVILDNEKHDNYNKYKEVFDSVKLSKDKPAKVLKMKWKTEKNKIDSGLYMMMHMELYQGESATNWKTDIVQENNRDYEMQMTNMRKRYITKILIHEMNTKRGLMSGYAKKFSEDNKDEEKVKKMVENAINKKIAEKIKFKYFILMICLCGHVMISPKKIST
ncbi:200 kDa antigen p200 [Tanacetum coccineum]